MVPTRGKTLIPPCQPVEGLPCQDGSGGEVFSRPQPGPRVQGLLRSLQEAWAGRNSARMIREETGCGLEGSCAEPSLHRAKYWSFQPDELFWPHLDHSLCPCPTTKVCRSQEGGGWLGCTLRQLLSGLRPSACTEFESVSEPVPETLISCNSHTT